MRTVVLGPRPPVLEAMIRDRARTGDDLYDEVWEGEYHMAPPPDGRHRRVEIELAVVLTPLAERAGLFPSGAFNLGEPDDYRVPGLGLLRDPEPPRWYATAALVVEIVSPGDESWQKFGFYAAHEVDEVAIADPADRSLRWFRRAAQDYEPVTRSDLLDIDVADLHTRVKWPPAAAD